MQTSPMPSMPEQGENGKQYTVAEYKLMQELGKKIVQLYSDFAKEKDQDIPWDIFLASVDFVIKAHRRRANLMLNSFLKLEAAAAEYGISITEPFSEEISALSNPGVAGGSIIKP